MTDSGTTNGSYVATADELRQYVERYEQQEAEKKDVSDRQKELLQELKSRGYDSKVFRKVIALRRRDAASVAEEESILELYKAALGMS